MPPRQTDITPKTEAEAAGLGLGLAIASAKDAVHEALAAARLNVSIAAPDEALPEKDAVGLTAALTRDVLSLLRRYWRAFQERRRRQSSRTALQDLSDRELLDIGLTRAEIDYITPQRAFDTLRDSTRYLWDRGVM